MSMQYIGLIASVISIILISLSAGFVLGARFERLKWNELIDKGILPRPKGETMITEDGLELEDVKKPWKWIVPVGDMPYCLLSIKGRDLLKHKDAPAVVIERVGWNSGEYRVELYHKNGEGSLGIHYDTFAEARKAAEAWVKEMAKLAKLFEKKP